MWSNSRWCPEAPTVCPPSGARSFWAPLFSGAASRTRLPIAFVYHALVRFELTGDDRWARLALGLVNLTEYCELEELVEN